ncbi:MAG: hypothetical protein LUQ65_08655, partial [Candidatus Helarchaeota archaeon]|nr:hypothetical protein [Candidatus Helarchaeota archaeon]
SVARLHWDLSKDPGHKPKSNTGAMIDFSKWLQEKPSLDEKFIKEHTLALKYENNIRMLFNRFGLIGSELGRFLCDETFKPIAFAQKPDGIVFLVTQVYSNKIYNILSTTSKTRASKIISSMILPSMKAFREAFKNTKIKYYGMLVAYGSKDFSKAEYEVLDLQAEVVSLIVSAQNCKKFVEGVLTDDEFVAASEIYSVDRDMRNLKRIKITLE